MNSFLQITMPVNDASAVEDTLNVVTDPNAVEKGLENCIVLFENDIPTAFLAYTTVISEAIEEDAISAICFSVL